MVVGVALRGHPIFRRLNPSEEIATLTRGGHGVPPLQLVSQIPA
jgi:hypothetical protein